MLNLREYRARPASLADHLKWACLIAPGIVLNKDGSLQRTIAYRGPDLESSTAEELVAVTARMNNLLRRFGSGWALHIEADRRPSVTYPESVWRDPAAWLVDEERRAAFEETGRHFETDCYLTLAWMPPADRTARIEQLFIEDPADAPAAFWSEHLAYFETETSRALDLMADLMPEARFLNDDETLTYLHACISTARQSVRAPSVPMCLDALLVDTPLTGGLSPRLGDETLKVLTINGFPATGEPGLLSELDQLGFAYRWVTRFLPLDKPDAEKTLNTYVRNWFAKRRSLTSYLREILTNEPATLLNTDASNQAADADEALQALGAGHVTFGYCTTAIVVRHADAAVAEEQVRAVERVIRGRGFTCVHESINAIEAWLGTLPGEAYANVRQPLLNTINLSHMAPLSSLWAGPERNAHLDGPPLLMARSASSTPFRLVTHQGDVGHMMVVGPTGAGKSVLLSLLALQFRRYEQAQVFIFDKGASARCATLALGGTWYDLGLEGDLAFQPLRDVGGEAGLAAAQAWVLELIEQEGVSVTPEVKQAVWTALQSLGAAPVAQRTLTGLVALLQMPDLRQALEPYTLAGPYGALLDVDEDNLEAGDMLCFEMDTLMQDKRLAAPVLAHLFTKLEARFDGRPTLLILDEAWLFLDHPMFAGRLRDWLKTLRKKNVSVVFATQSLSDISTSAIAPSLIESATTRIFLANARAEEPSQCAAYEGFGLNARQVELITRATPKRDYYVQTPDGNRLFDLDLGPVALAFCAAGSKADQKLISEILAAVGPEGFAPAWLVARGLHWAADLIAAEGEMPCAAE
ncbi:MULTISPECIES: conjugal transfer protein TrbE [Hyphomonas]|uniref:Conjugal transfer protein TrbE n=1 Tax=Hyphomonas adhaerens TaxID=81029 RepID=A0A3B9GYW4_9PROT|nr:MULTISPECIES: conjugal transfer protein TrbE [Hyphomonas]MBB39103.1 conjugal transfer protein TrbE [Hyphomonas sp.]HAE27184.1 conjugal transfer protein TrbE [Hyphomonas adhaerens]|tara:strand:+ start:2487 stop:4916 length:2430 start_codon:yes stop_codon:yes gene_type:complete